MAVLLKDEVWGSGFLGIGNWELGIGNWELVGNFHGEGLVQAGRLLSGLILS